MSGAHGISPRPYIPALKTESTIIGECSKEYAPPDLVETTTNLAIGGAVSGAALGGFWGFAAGPPGALAGAASGFLGGGAIGLSTGMFGLFKPPNPMAIREAHYERDWCVAARIQKLRGPGNM